MFFITGRKQLQANDDDELYQATIKNLEKAGYEDWKKLILRPEKDNRTVAGYKSAEREKIALDHYTIIANVGDQRSDLKGGFAERAYKLPNPFYYIP